MYRTLLIITMCFIILAACSPTEVIKTVVITQEVQVAGTPEIKQVVITATPEPVKPTEVTPRTLVICMGQEPDTLYYSSMLAAGQILSAIYDGPIDNNTFAYQPVILQKLPSLADGDAVINPVPVKAGDTVVDNDGNPATLTAKSGDSAGTVVRPAGCRSAECAVEFDGSNVSEMDQLEVTSKLLPGLLWSDGTPLTSADSVYAYQLSGDPATPGSRYTFERTASYEATDELTTVWTGVSGFLDSTYMLDFFAPFPQHVMGQYSAAELVTGFDAQGLWIGWGPYVIDEWKKGEQVNLHKNPNYFRVGEGLPYFDKLIFRFTGGDPNAEIAAVLAGECDIVDTTTALEGQSNLLLELQAKDQVNATFVTGTTFEHVSFNIQPNESIINSGVFAGWDKDGDGLGPFGDVRLRQAIAMCMDRQAVVDTALYGQSVVIDTYLPPNHPLFSADVKHWPYDLDAASALLDEIGWMDTDNDLATPRVAQGVTGVPDNTLLEFNYETTNVPMRQQVSQILAQNLAECGIKANLDYHPASEWFANEPDGRLFGRLYDLGEGAWISGSEPPCGLYLSSELPNEANGWGGLNFTGFNDPAFDNACLAAMQSLPGEEAYAANHLEAEKIFAEQLPAVPLFLRLKLAVTRPDMCNFVMDPTGGEMWNIENFDFGEGCSK